MDKKTVTIRSTVLGEGLPKICIPVTAKNHSELQEQIRGIQQTPCDLVEWRADFWEEYAQPDWIASVLEILRSQLGDLPLLFTFRTAEEGGVRAVSLEEYRQLCLTAADTGRADLVDVERNRGDALMQELVEKLHEKQVKVIGSFHDFHQTPSKETLLHILTGMQELGADITKAAVMPSCEQDVMTLLDSALAMKQQYGDRPCITMSMSALGAISRLAGGLTGSAVTFATAGHASAPGQMEAAALAALLPCLQ